VELKRPIDWLLRGNCGGDHFHAVGDLGELHQGFVALFFGGD
jgi:hypothetical protein